MSRLLHLCAFTWIAAFAGLAMSMSAVLGQEEEPQGVSRKETAATRDGELDPAKMDRASARLRQLLRHAPSRELTDALEQLERSSQSAVARVDRDRIRSVYDQALAGIRLGSPGDSDEADRVVRSFISDHAELFGLHGQEIPLARDTKPREIRGQASQRLTYDQYHKGIRVIDGSFAAFFSEDGAFLGLSGTPWAESDLPGRVKPRVSKQDATSAAMEHVRRSLKGSDLRFDLQGEAELVVSGRLRSLLWKVLVTHLQGLGVEREVWVDAKSGKVIYDHNLIYGAAEPASARYLIHPNGQKDDSGPGDENPSNRLTTINVNPEPFGSVCLVRLQRLGSGRARMWNARLAGGTSTSPLFGATMTLAPCNDLSQLTIFEQRPQSSTVDDSTFRFNEQSVYVRAQILKTQLDNWGRNPGANYGYYYPVDPGRDVNVEIVVNGDSARELDWCGFSVLHGCSRNNSPPPSAWFPGVATPRVVFLFNSSGNSMSPQFVGQEFTASYSIVAHEIGHFISWTYGGWSGTSSNMRTSLSEGMSMALPAVWAKQRWGGALAYTDSAEVTTGSFVDGSQWTHHPAGSPLRYDSLDCQSENAYKLAWPWVQAMWELANNVNRETGEGIWTSGSAARENTADFLMDILYTQAGISGRDWSDITSRMLVHQLLRHFDGRERGARSDFESFFRTAEVLNHHGLFGNCQ